MSVREPAQEATASLWGGRDAAAALAIFFIALCVRLFYLAEIDEVPFYLHPIMDAKAYDAWAVRIASGDWLGSDTFYQAPAYPYLLAVIYSAVGHDVHLAHVILMVLGSLSCVLLFLATRMLFFRPAGVAAGILIAFYPVAFFFDGQIGKTGLALFLMSFLILALCCYQRERRWGWALASGAILGLLALTRENALVFVPVVPLWMAWRAGVGGGGRLP